MDGGRLVVHGSVGDYGGFQMTAGMLRINGNAGARLADRMRRGLLLVGGNAGEFAASRLVAGTVGVAGQLGTHYAYGMRRGTLLLARRPAHCRRHSQAEAMVSMYSDQCSYAVSRMKSLRFRSCARTACRPATTQGLLYAGMVAMPLAGYPGSSFNRYGTRFWGILLPKWGWDDAHLRELFFGIHRAVAYALIVLHVAGALKHQWIDRDNLLARMRP